MTTSHDRIADAIAGGALDDNAAGFLEGLAYLLAKGCALKAVFDALRAHPPDEARRGQEEEVPPIGWDMDRLAACGWEWAEDERSGAWCFVSFYPGG